MESRGQLRFEDAIHSILDLQNTKIPENVQIKHLLNHTSGIADDAEEEKGQDYAALFIDSPNYALRENKDYREFITEEIFKPFHMDNTFFTAKDDSDRPCA